MNKRELAGVPTADLLKAATAQSPVAADCLNLSTKLIEHGNSTKNGNAYMPLCAIQGDVGREKFAYLSYEISLKTKKPLLNERIVPVDMITTLHEATRYRMASATLTIMAESDLGGRTHYIRVGDYGVNGGEPKRNELVINAENINLVIARVRNKESIKDLIAAQKNAPATNEPSGP